MFSVTFNNIGITLSDHVAIIKCDGGLGWLGSHTTHTAAAAPAAAYVHPAPVPVPCCCRFWLLEVEFEGVKGRMICGQR